MINKLTPENCRACIIEREEYGAMFCPAHYIETTPEDYQLRKDGAVILDAQNDWIIANWLHKHHSYSVSYAIAHEGYKIFFDGKDISNKYILK